MRCPSSYCCYHRYGLRDASAQYCLDKLNQLMLEGRCYLDGDLSLQQPADKLRISPHHLSQVLNNKLGKNFYDYINEQRVEYAKQLLRNEPHKAIIDVALATGYNNKISFYNTFKRHASTSPSDSALETVKNAVNPSGFATSRAHFPQTPLKRVEDYDLALAGAVSALTFVVIDINQ